MAIGGTSVLLGAHQLKSNELTMFMAPTRYTGKVCPITVCTCQSSNNFHNFMAAYELKGHVRPITTTASLSNKSRHMMIAIVSASKGLRSEVTHVRVYGNDALKGKLRPHNELVLPTCASPF